MQAFLAWIHMALVFLFTPEVKVALVAVFTAAGIDAGLTVLLAAMKRLDAPFDWRKVPQFLLTNVFPFALGLVLAGVLLQFYPDLNEVYFATTAGITAWLAKDWRAKLKKLIGLTMPDGTVIPSIEVKVQNGPTNDSELAANVSRVIRDAVDRGGPGISK